MRLDGSELPETISVDPTGCSAVAVDDSSVYLASTTAIVATQVYTTQISSIPKVDGGGVLMTLGEVSGTGSVLALDSTHVYVGSTRDGGLFAVPIQPDAGPPVTLSRSDVVAIALDGE